MTEDVANAAQPIYGLLCVEAAKGKIIQNDDTKAQVLSIEQEIKENEQLIKRAVLNRKNAYFFHNETGAKIADILMSIIETCVYNNVNPWKYLIIIQEQQKDIRRTHNYGLLGAMKNVLGNSVRHNKPAL